MARNNPYETGDEMTLEEITERLKKAPKLVTVDDYEISAQRISKRKESFFQGSKILEASQDELWVSLRLSYRRQPGYAVSFVSGESDLMDLVDQAFDAAKNSQPDPWFRFAFWKPIAKRESEFSSVTPENISERLSEFPVGESVYENARVDTRVCRKTERTARFHRGEIDTVWANVNVESEQPFEIREKKRITSTTALEKWLSELHEQQSVYQKSKPIEGSEFRQILLCPTAVKTLLRSIAPWFCADENDKSPILFSKGSEVISRALTLIDDGEHPLGYRSGPFDLEGVNSQKTILIQQGFWDCLLHDTYLAARHNRPSTGNSFRSQEGNFQKILPSTLYFEAGKHKKEELISGAKEALVVEQISSFVPAQRPGTFRLTAAGWQRTPAGSFVPYHNLQITCDVIEWFRRTVLVGNDLTFFADVGSPSLLIDNVP